MRTSQQAQGLWCPFARTWDGPRAPLAISSVATVNRDLNGNPATGTMCLGSGCMAWQWHDPAVRDLRSASATEPRPANVPESWTWEPGKGPDNPDGWLEPIAEAMARRRGYCGLVATQTTLPGRRR